MFNIYLKGKPNKFESEKINHIMQNISNKTNLILEKDIIKIDKGFNLFNNKYIKNKENKNNHNHNNEENKEDNDNSMNSIFDILEENPGKIQYLIVFCLSE
jgi:hypothetical protein